MIRGNSIVNEFLNSQINHQSLPVLQNKVKDNQALIERLCLTAKLPVHQGCVNTVAWDSSGRNILSGSDDLNLCITDAFTHKVRTTIRTGHRSNIFSAKYLPCTENRHVISCSGDGGIIFTDIERPETSRSNLFSCHLGTTYDVVTSPQDPNTFFSCGDDSTVRFFDLRVKKSCWTMGDCKEDILINFSNPVMAITVNQRFPYLLAAGSADSNTYVFDRRMLPGRPITTGDIHPTVKRFYVPVHEGGNHRITSLSFSPDGDDLLVSYSCDSLYMFNMKDEGFKPQELKERYKMDINAESQQRPSVKRVRVRGDWSDTGPDARPESQRGHTNGEAGSRADFILLLSHAAARFYNRPRMNNATNQNRPNRRRPYPPNLSTSQLSGGNNNDNATNNASVLDSSQSFDDSLLNATPRSPDSHSGPESNISLGALNTSQNFESQPSTSAQAASTTSTLTTGSMRDLQVNQDIDLESSLDLSNSSNLQDRQSRISNPISRSINFVNELVQNSNSTNAQSSNRDAQSWQGERNISNESMSTSQGREQRLQSNHPNESDESNIERDNSRDRLFRSLTNVVRQYKERKNKIWTTLPSPVYKQKYSGHRHARTMIKKATFWGNNYVMSGSDCGHIFIWNRHSGKLVMVMEGDQHVVNCLQPHPFDPILASSGIDHDIKIWSPLAEESLWNEEEAQKIMNINEVMSSEAKDTKSKLDTIISEILLTFEAPYIKEDIDS